MCRLAAFPPHFSRKEALGILLEFEGGNTDGTGYSYIKNDNFVTEKWPKELSKLLKHNSRFLAHMPHPGWTIAHLRAASHGTNCIENTHPFNIGKWAICHNGIWNDYEPAKLALSSYVAFKGETDSEVAAHLINNLGPKKFASAVTDGGVFLALKNDGSLWIMKTSGSLVMQNLPNKCTLIASELEDEKYNEQGEAHEGWYHFDKAGHYVSHKCIVPEYLKGFHSRENDNTMFDRTEYPGMGAGLGGGRVYGEGTRHAWNRSNWD